MGIVHHYLYAFVATVVLELAVAVPVLAPGGAWPRRVAVVIVAQLATHPSVWFFWTLFDWPRPVYLVVAECFALVVETLIYRLFYQQLSWSRALAASALANGASVLIGSFIQ